MKRGELLRTAAVLPFALRAGPAALTRALGGTPLALVTADTESRVVAVDLVSGRIRRSIATLPGPRSVESSLETIAVVAHTGHGALSLIDGRTLEVTHVLRGFDEPRYTAAAPGGRYAFVSDSGRADLAVVDLHRGTVVRRVDLGGPARHITVDRAGRQVWCSLGSKAEMVVALDVTRPTRPELRRLLRPPFLAHDVAFTPSGRQAWVTSGDRGVIAVYDAATGRPAFTISADAPPQHVTFIGIHAYVTSGDDGTLRVHRLSDGRLVRSTSVPAGSYNVQQGFGLVLTPSLERGTLCILDRSGALERRIQVAPSSHDACFVMSA